MESGFAIAWDGTILTNAGVVDSNTLQPEEIALHSLQLAINLKGNLT